MQTLQIMLELRDLLPPLSTEEYQALKESILAEGCREPLVVWDGKIVDGHNRYSICLENNVHFDTKEIIFADIEEAKDWIDKNQIARRNLTPDDLRLAIGRRYLRMKKKQGEHKGNQHTLESGKSCHFPKTEEVIARESGVSPKTVRNAAKLAQAVEEVRQAEPEVAEQGREAVIARAKEIVKPHVANNSGNNEWYTPEKYIAAARALMGDIDLDPASCAKANEVVKASQFYSSDDDGTNKPWAGRVWMNPPYSSDLISRFAAKLCEEFVAGNVDEACVLVNNATETKWFQLMASHAAACCFLNGRVKFWQPDGKQGAPLQGQAVLYFGENTIGFQKEFFSMGAVCVWLS